MISLTRSGRLSLALSLDADGQQRLRSAVEELVRAAAQVEVLVMLDPGIPGRRRIAVCEAVLRLSIGDGEMERTAEGLHWALEFDEAELLLQRLKDRALCGAYVPAELTHVRSGARPNLDMVYLADIRS